MRQVHNLISVIVPTYNRAEMLKDALQSLVCQRTNGRFSFEIIIVDNASTDHTLTVFKELENKYPSLLRYAREEKKGLLLPRIGALRKPVENGWLSLTMMN